MLWLHSILRIHNTCNRCVDLHRLFLLVTTSYSKKNIYIHLYFSFDGSLQWKLNLPFLCQDPAEIDMLLEDPIIPLLRGPPFISEFLQDVFVRVRVELRMCNQHWAHTSPSTVQWPCDPTTNFRSGMRSMLSGADGEITYPWAALVASPAKNRRWWADAGIVMCGYMSLNWPGWYASNREKTLRRFWFIPGPNQGKAPRIRRE